MNINKRKMYLIALPIYNYYALIPTATDAAVAAAAAEEKSLLEHRSFD